MNTGYALVASRVHAAALMAVAVLTLTCWSPVAAVMGLGLAVVAMAAVEALMKQAYRLDEVTRMDIFRVIMASPGRLLATLAVAFMAHQLNALAVAWWEHVALYGFDLVGASALWLHFRVIAAHRKGLFA